MNNSLMSEIENIAKECNIKIDKTKKGRFTQDFIRRFCQENVLEYNPSIELREFLNKEDDKKWRLDVRACSQDANIARSDLCISACKKIIEYYREYNLDYEKDNNGQIIFYTNLYEWSDKSIHNEPERKKK
jgi:hypothetical protein